jgi:putative membrane protein
VTDADGERIAAAIAEAERTTCAEIRVLVVDRSLRWPFRLALAAVPAGAVAFALAASRLAWDHPRGLDVALAALLGAALAPLLALAPALIPAVRRRAVRRRAERELLRLGMTATRERTGVLLMLSAREHRVQVLADQGIAARVPPRAWEDVVRGVVDAIHAGRAADGLAAAVRQIGEIAAAHSPRRADDVNELPDHLERAP